MAKEIKSTITETADSVLQSIDLSEGATLDKDSCNCNCNYTVGSVVVKEDSVLWGKVAATKLCLLDKIKEGLDNGHNIEHLVNLSKIYSNLSF